MSDAVTIGLAVIIAGSAPLVPRMICLRIRVLRFLRWNRLAELHETYFHGIVLAVRAIMVTIAAILLVAHFVGGVI